MKSLHAFCLLVLLTPFLTLWWCSEGYAGSFPCREQDVLVKTVLQHPYRPGAPNQTRVWVLRFSQPTPDICRVAFYLQGGATKLAELTLDYRDDLICTYQAFNRPLRFSSRGFLQTLNSPVPCNILPGPGNEPLTFSIKRSAGDSIFRHDYQIEKNEIDVAEARARGWLPRSVLDQSSSLYTVTVRDVAKDRIVLRQLRQDNASWWLYEQTPFYHAYRIRE